MLRQGVPDHSVPGLDQSLDAPARRVIVRARVVSGRRLHEDAVELGQHQRDGAAGGRVVRAVDVPFEQVLDLLLPTPSLDRVGRALGVEAEQHGVASGEEFLDWLVGTERDVLSLVVLDDEVEPRRTVVEPQIQFGLGQRARGWLARLDLRNFLGQVLGAGRVGRRQAQPWNLAGRGLSVEHRQERRLAHVPMAEQRDPLRTDQPIFQRVELVIATVQHATNPSGPSELTHRGSASSSEFSSMFPGLATMPNGVVFILSNHVSDHG